MSTQHDAHDTGQRFSRVLAGKTIPYVVIGNSGYHNRHQLATDAVAGLDGAQLLVRKACWAMDSAQDDAGALAAMAFVFAAETAYHATTHSLHVHGGYEFMEEYDIQLYYRRAKAWAAAFADPRRELLTVANRRFGPVTTGGR